MPMPKERAGIIVMACAGILALILGIWQINYNIKSPFKLKPMDKSLLNGNQAPDLLKDTDGDGFSDYEEASIYSTSLYLADTDSDGVSDSQEIQNGTDPNCPEGKDCKASTESAQTPAAASALETPPVAALPADSSTAIPTNLTTDQIRQLLKQGGMSDADLNKLNDKMLLEIYNETLKEMSEGE